MNKIIIIVLSFLLFSCNKDNDFETKRVYSVLNKSFTDTLQVESISSIVQMRLEIKGRIDGEGILYYSHFPFSGNYKIKIHGIVNQTIRTDWYDSRCLIKYIPKDSTTKGELKINFRVDNL